ncbi:MAG TPA: [acyl-carrier-protein] S-malonyltransferase [Betaproteobacteria bacterium]|nr:[acyl-carrier-protein] S-malonyltransferase [Betaproteobacteria bacterium]
MNIAFVFPGQGAQSPGMMAGFEDIPAVRGTFEEASDILKQDVWALVAAGARADDLNQTLNTQPVMLTAGMAVYRAWRAIGGDAPSLLAGHSLGEYTALVAAGALEFDVALPLVRYRAQCMQTAVAEGKGAMAAVLGLDDDTVRAACAQAAEGEVVDAVNFNSPGQVVIAGEKQAVERAMAVAREKGAKRVVWLPVSVPSHCALMRPAAAALANYLQTVTLTPPTIPVLHNADVAAYTEASAIKDALVRQLYNPVRWVETLRAMANQEITHVAECGPGKVLTGLNKRIDAAIETLSLMDTVALKAAKSILTPK